MICISTADPDEAIAAVSEVYCEHELRLDRRKSGRTRLLADNQDEGLAHVALEYGAHADVDAGSLDSLVLVMHATGGSGAVRQAGRYYQWRAGQTIAVAGNQPTQYAFERGFAQSTLRLDPTRIRTYCEQAIGHQLDDDVRFEPVPFPADLESMWAHILSLALRSTDIGPHGRRSLEQLAIDLLLRRGLHNYSHLFSQPPPTVPRLASEAIALIGALADHELVTVAELAARLCVSTRSLERAFHESVGTGPAQYLRDVRLDRARRQLERPQRTESVTDVAAAYGFFHAGRFAKYYRDRFGESPSVTARRGMAASSDTGLT